MSRQIVIVEHVIGGMKIYKYLIDKFRNKKEGINDLFIYLLDQYFRQFVF